MSESHPLSRRARIVLGLLALLLAGGIAARLALGGTGASDDDDAPPPPPEATLAKDAGGQPVLQLAKGQARALGLTLAQAQATTATEAQPVHGVILDPLPLLDLDHRRRAATAALAGAQAASTAADAELARVQALHAADRGASDKALQDAIRADREARAQLALARGEAAKATAAWRETGLQGTAGLADFRQVLVRLDLPLGRPAPSPLPGRLDLTFADGGGPRPFRVVGLAPGGSPLTGGLALLAVGPGTGLRPGLPADAALAGAPGTRVAVPRGAVLWSGGRARVFVQVGEDRFQPREVVPVFQTGGDAILDRGLKPGETVAVQGALNLQGEYERLAEGAAIGAGGV